MPTWDKNIAILVLIIDKLRRLRVANPYNSASTAYSHQQLHVNNDFAELFEGSHMLRYPVQVGHDHDHVFMGTIQLIWNSHSIREGHLKNNRLGVRQRGPLKWWRHKKHERQVSPLRCPLWNELHVCSCHWKIQTQDIPSRHEHSSVTATTSCDHPLFQCFQCW